MAGLSNTGALASLENPQELLHTLGQQSLRLCQQKKYAQAIPLLKTCVALAPEDYGLWCNLGAALRSEKHYAAAVGCYQKALGLKADDAGVCSNMGNVLKDMDRSEEALHYHARAVALQPENRHFLINHAIALSGAKKFQEALVPLDHLLQQDPDNPFYQWERALVNLYLGNYDSGWREYEARWKTGELPVKEYQCPRWQGESLTNKKILLISEQGYGDTLLAARFIPLLKARGAHIAFECKKELRPVFASLPIEMFIDARVARYKPGDFDYHCHLMSLMGLLGIHRENIPAPVPISIPAASREKMRFIEASGKNKLKVGIVWSGSLSYKDNARRSCTLERFLSLAEMPGIQCYSLQKGEREKDLDRCHATPLIIDLAKKIEHFGDTAAAIEALDLIVMTDSSVAHLAGSLHKPVINLLAYKSYWIYSPETDTTPWYPSMKLIRQEKPGNWEGVFERARKEIAALA